MGLNESITAALTGPPPRTGIHQGSCPHCSRTVEYEPVGLLPKIVPLCDACEARQTGTWAETERRHAWQRHFQARMPVIYQKSDAGLVQPCFQPALTWKPGAGNSIKPGGLGIIGRAGAGKSCALACRLFTLERSFRWWSGTEAREAAVDAASAEKDREGAARRWEAAMRVPLLALDDISQARFTEAWSSRLFDLLETRLSHGLPVLWTSQIPLDELRHKIVRQNGGDAGQAEAISRRLSQHSLVLRG